MNIYSLIKQAIIHKDQVIATYNGHRREMCPHVIGRKGGRQQALFFQFAGGRSSGLPAGGEWRCIPVDRLTDVVVRPGPWHTGTSHTQEQTCVDVVDAEVAF